MPRVATISPEATRVMVMGFHERTPAAVIAKNIKSATGEKVAPRTIARRAALYRAEESRRQSAQDQMSGLVAAMKANDLTAEEMLRALAVQALLEDPSGLRADPIALQELRIKQLSLELRQRAIVVNEKKLGILQAQIDDAKRATQDLAEKAQRGAQISDKDFDAIRGIYGLKPMTTEAAH